MIRAESVSWSYGDTVVLDRASVATAPGRVLGLIGPNGSGKTTLMRSLYGALRQAPGAVTVDGEQLDRLGAREVARRIAVVVQESHEENAMTVAETVLMGRTPHRPPLRGSTPEDVEIATRSLDRVGALHLGPRQISGLSGGERQRVMIARALAQEATHLLLDEPTNHLDVRFQHEILQLVRELETSAVVVLHDLNLAARYCDDLVLLDRGRVVAAGPVAEVLEPGQVGRTYQIEVERLDRDGEIHLLFRPGSRRAAEAEREEERVR